MKLEELNQKVIELDVEIAGILKQTGHTLEILEDAKTKKDKRLYDLLHDIVGHLDYVHYKLHKYNQNKEA